MSIGHTPTAPHPFHDHGLDHAHGWASDRRHGGGAAHRPVAADPARLPTASSALHDDVHYGS